MKGNLQRLRELTRAGLHRAGTAVTRSRAGLKKAWAKAPDLGRKAVLWLSQAPRALLKSVNTIWTAIKLGLRNHIQAWTKADWFAGIQPLPRDMASQLAAHAIMGGIILISLVYGEGYQDRLWRGRLSVSGELDQRTAHLVPNPKPPEPNKDPAAGTDAPKAEPVPPPRVRLNQLGAPFIERFQSGTLSDHWYISDGWSNGDHMDNDWRTSQVSVGPTGMVLTMETAPKGHPKPLVSAEVRTLPFYRYGYFETRVRVPKGSGIVTGIFTYAHIAENIRSNEIDIEILGKDTRTLEATIHQNGKSSLKRIRLPFDAADGFHTLGFDWQPDSVRWYADGKMIFEETGPPAIALIRPQQFIFDLWGSTPMTEWVGPFDRSKGPWKLEIACVAYEPAYPGRAIC